MVDYWMLLFSKVLDTFFRANERRNFAGIKWFVEVWSDTLAE